jgi:hypothetical protein
MANDNLIPATGRRVHKGISLSRQVKGAPGIEFAFHEIGVGL